MRIAMIGGRGVPATYGGIERHVEEVGSRLVDRGHEVTVYCRPNYVADDRAEHRGMQLRQVPTMGTKHLDAIVHSGLSTAHALRGRFDVLHYHAVGPAVLSGLARATSRATVVATVHGLDSRRGKWGRGASAALSSAEWLVGRAPHETVVVSQDLQRHFSAAYGRRTSYIPNGAPPPGRTDDAVLGAMGLRPGGYLLFVGRLVPEKAPDQLVEAFSALPGDVELVVAGGSSFSDAYVERVRELSARDSRVRLPDYVYGAELAALYAGAAAFVLPSSLEGLPLTLLEAASHGTPVVASDIAPHLEVLGPVDAPGRRRFRSGDVADLTAALARSLQDPQAERLGGAALQREVVARYSWDRVVDELEVLYARRAGTRTGGARAALV